MVSGRVQGVYYRDTCRQMAHRLDVRGWIRNRADGRVELAVEGETEAVDALIDWCRTGPSGAVVTELEVSDEDPVGDPSFRITS